MSGGLILPALSAGVAVDRQKRPDNDYQADHEEDNAHHLKASEEHPDPGVHPGCDARRKTGNAGSDDQHLTGEDIREHVHRTTYEHDEKTLNYGIEESHGADPALEFCYKIHSSDHLS